MPVEATIGKARAELAAGNHRRAKEIVHSSLGNYGYSPKLYRFYGEILLSMGDELQAGRYLFYSVDNPNTVEREAIDLFLERHGGENFKALLAAGPKFHAQSLSDFPSFARRRLSELGAPENLERAMKSDNLGWLWLSGCLLAALVIMVLAVIGAFTVIQHLF
ncbi:DUF6584 family protein [Roseibacillus ishigakijimensis]|uniref:Uncharacterized protein n=1 Tax=Roseibacillus ishigakijimensis TaxID=454146 RepID=A0A934RN91_9BACT|nr:DUF6584 family protein [Roseibacillus ishigakijimensis]MBK1834922.1 hypothetical protein [Roseibacillus ishigakijimensis]